MDPNVCLILHILHQVEGSLTVVQVPNPADIDGILEKYSTLKKDAKKDGKPYILEVNAGKANTDPRNQGYSFLAVTKFASVEDMKHNDSADASFEIELIRELVVDQTKAAFAVPALFTNPPPIQDGLETQTSKARSDTMQKCLPFLLNDDTSDSPIPKQNSFGIPSLRKKDHVNFLHGNLADFPAPFVAMDASRPWLFYWSLAGLSFLGEDVSEYRERLVQTVKPLQNATGGFGGGHGQLSHIASSYACVLSLAIVGGKEALELVDRKAMYVLIIRSDSGGLRDKPGARPDAYHTCYSLAGLNAAQNPYYYSPDTKGNPAPLSASFNWRVDATKEEGVPFDEDDRIRLVHPVYVLPWGTAEQTRDFFKDKDVD
ncbi:MAG: hypothetical protein Q9157_003492 [Trypethelium eluteriae]